MSLDLATYPETPATDNILLRREGGSTISRRALGSVVDGIPLSSISSRS